MKIVIISKSDTTGGAAIAAKRLKDALQANGNSVTMLVQEKKTTDQSVFTTGDSKSKKRWNFLLFIIERLYFYFFEKSKSIRFAFSPAVAGEDISNHPLVKDADIIHIHWFNQGYLSLNNLKKLIKLNKAIVWTLHDMWAFTGGCHYSGDCANYKDNCGNCKFLKHAGNQDLSTWVHKRKMKIIENSNIQFVTCSNWLASKAKESSILNDFDIKAIPNPIDNLVFKPMDKLSTRLKLGLPPDKKLILFGSANVADERKGLKYLVEALHKLVQIDPLSINKFEVVIFGKSNELFLKQISYKVNNLGLIKGDENIADIYSASDVFVLPSIEDNLPNTIMESLACGTPVVAFNTGGIPEMIDHKVNGYLAEFKSVDDLLNGIQYVLDQDKDKLREASIEKVERSYTQKIICEKYNLCYKSLIH
jgi:glycosyltransferase involved in cell wall biosynthesis